MALEDIIKSISDEAERGQFTALLDKYAPVKEYLTLGDQVKPVFDKLTAAGLPAVAEIGRAADWAEYRDKHWLGERKMWDSQAAAVDEAEALKTKVTELESRVSTGAEMTIDEIKAQLAADGYVKKTDLASVIDGKTLEGAMQLQAKRFEEVNATLESKQFEHYEKYKTALPRAEIYALMEKTGERDVLKAYAEVVKPLEHKAEIDRLNAESSKKFEEGKQKGIEEAQARVNAQKFPVDGGGSARHGAGHFMNKVFGKRQAATAQGGGKLGTGSSAQAGFADYTAKKMGNAAV